MIEDVKDFRKKLGNFKGQSFDSRAFLKLSIYTASLVFNNKHQYFFRINFHQLELHNKYVKQFILFT